MKKFVTLLLLIFCLSCEKEAYKTTEFLLRNDCDYIIEIKSSALVRYNDGYREETLTDIVQSGELLSMRKINVSENFSINDVFTKIEIYRGETKSAYDIMDKNNWVKTSSSKDKDEYTIKSKLVRFASSRGFENGKVFDMVSAIIEMQKNK